ncbi:MAG: oligosaccharide flippase family protein, partial [Frankia sp.]
MRDLVTRLMRGPSSLAIAGMVVNGANLVANLTLARMLDPHSYGAVVELTNIFMILSMIGSSLQVAVVQRDTAIEEQGRTATRAWIRRLRGKCIAGVAVATLAGLALARPVCALLSFPHRIAFAEVVAAAALWSAISIERGLLQSRAAYPTLARNLSYEGAVRVVGTIVLVGIGAGVDGASAALIIGLLVGIEHARRASALTVRPARSGRRGGPSAAARAAAAPRGGAPRAPARGRRG